MASGGLWEHLAQRRQQHRDLQNAPPVIGDVGFDRLCFIVLSSGPGQELLQMLRKRTIDAPDDMFGSESALRAKAAQSQFVRDIEAAAERGRKASEPKGTT